MSTELKPYSYHVKIALLENLNQAKNNPSVKTIVLCGKGNFLAGGDIKEFSNQEVPGNVPVRELCNFIEAYEKPVIAAINGYALGGGFEIALSCHYRIAHQNARFGLPEVNIGVIPGSATLRLPRLTSLKASLDLIPSGRQFDSTEAIKLQLIDKLTDSDVVSVAVEFAKSVADKPLAPRRVSCMTVRDASQAEQLRTKALAFVAQKFPGRIAPLFSIKAIMASVELPFVAALQYVQQLFHQLLTSSQAKALQYAFFAERQATRWVSPDGKNNSNIEPKPIRIVGIIGLGAMGAGIAVTVLSAGFPVILVENDEQRLDIGIKLVCKLLEESVAIKKLSENACKAAITRLQGSLKIEDLSDVDLVIEAVYENLSLKKKVFAELDKTCKKDAILCSNTSSLNIDEIAASTRWPDKVMGMHFFMPAYFMKLLENVKSSKTSPETIATVMAFSRKIGKMPVLVGNCWLFVANRIWSPLRFENEFLVEEGATPADIDQVMEDFGFPLGPFKVLDMTGMDVRYKVLVENLSYRGIKLDVSKKFINGERFCPLLALMIEKNRLGRKTGRGWYRYEKPGAKIPYHDDEAIDIIEKYRKSRSIESRKISPQEILNRCLLVTINEAFKVLEEGIANSPEAIDTIMINAYGWPRHTGGPLFFAQQIGLAKVYDDICELHQRFFSSVHWYPSQLLHKLAKGNITIENWSSVALKFYSSHL